MAEGDDEPGNAYVAALRRWAFTDTAGRRHVARPLGFDTAFYWLEVFRWAGNNPKRLLSTSNRFIRDLYPPQRCYWITLKLRAGVPGAVVSLAAAALLAWRWSALLTLGWLAVPIVLLTLLALGVCWVGPGVPDPVAEFLRLDAPGQTAAITDFFLFAGLIYAVPLLPPRTRRKASRISAAASPPRPRVPAPRGA